MAQLQNNRLQNSQPGRGAAEGSATGMSGGPEREGASAALAGSLNDLVLPPVPGARESLPRQPSLSPMKGASALGLGMEGGAVRNLTRFTLHGIASLPEGGFEIVRIPPGHTVGGGMADGRTRDVDFVTSAAPEVKQEGGKTVFVFDQAVQGMKIGDRQLVDIVERNDGVITFKETRRLAGGIKVQTIGQMNAGRPVEYAPVEYALKAADQGGADSAD